MDRREPPLSRGSVVANALRRLDASERAQSLRHGEQIDSEPSPVGASDDESPACAVVNLRLTDAEASEFRRRLHSLCQLAPRIASRVELNPALDLGDDREADEGGRTGLDLHAQRPLRPSHHPPFPW